MAADKSLLEAETSACSSKALLAAGRKVVRTLGCYANATTKGLALDSGCVAIAESKFTVDIAAAAALGDCLVPVDTTTLGRKVDALVDELTTSLQSAAGQSACTGKKLTAAGKKALGRIRCVNKGIRRGVTLATIVTCYDKEDLRFGTSWVTAEAASACNAAPGDRETIAERIAGFEDDLTTDALLGLGG